jgi:hypothetical protein
VNLRIIERMVCRTRTRHSEEKNAKVQEEKNRQDAGVRERMGRERVREPKRKTLGAMIEKSLVQVRLWYRRGRTQRVGRHQANKNK